jgi:SAM-dependent methyltransferase
MDQQLSCRPKSGVGGSLARWFEEQPGSLLLEQECEVLERLLCDRFGYFLLQVGLGAHRERLLKSCRVRSCLVVDSGFDPASCEGADFRGDPLRLPVASDSVDAILLPHTLDFSPDPHQVLREVERVLIPEGRLIVTGFNPWGMWGLWRLFGWRSRKIPWCGRFISLRRLCDWLSLLGFEVEVTETLMYRPPIRNTAVMERLQLLERLGRRFWPQMSSGYVIQAVRRVLPLTPVGPAWKKRGPLFGGRVVEPTTRSSSG